MPSMDELERMRAASGEERSGDRLVAFLYLLAIDVPLGVLEEKLDDVADRDAPREWRFTNGWVAAWAKDAAARLRPPVDDA